MNNPKDQQEQIRRDVSSAYARAIAQPAGEGCCGGIPAQKGVAAKLAGYTAEELQALPSDSVSNSFGCGNPLAFAGVKEGDVVLDLGSGAGIDILLAAKLVGPEGKVIGVDMTDEMIARAQENISTSGLNNVEVRKGIIEELPVESGTVDWVISNCVINLSPDKPRVFAELSRVLKPGGRMAVSDIVARDLPSWVQESAALYSSCIAGAISEEEYLRGLEDAGLGEVEVRERLVYDVDQLGAFADSEVGALAEKATCCGGGTIDPETLRHIARSMEGKVWSAKFHARKPA